MTKKAPSFKSTATALLMPWLLVQVAQVVGQGPVDISIRNADLTSDNCSPSENCPSCPGPDCGQPPNVPVSTRGASPVSTNAAGLPVSTNTAGLPNGTGSGSSLNPGMDVSSQSVASSPTPRPHKVDVGAIVGGVVGGVAFLALLGALLFFLMRRRSKSDAEGNYQSVVVLDKSRASSPTSMSAAYGGVPPPPVAAPLPSGSPPPPPPPPPALLHPASAPPGPSAPALTPGAVAGYSDRGVMQDSSPPQLQQQPQAAPAPQQIAAPPAELHSREVDEDGISVSSLDLHRPAESISVPRLPVYQRQSPPGSGTIGGL